MFVASLIDVVRPWTLTVNGQELLIFCCIRLFSILNSSVDTRPFKITRTDAGDFNVWRFSPLWVAISTRLRPSGLREFISSAHSLRASNVACDDASMASRAIVCPSTLVIVSNLYPDSPSCRSSSASSFVILPSLIASDTFCSNSEPVNTGVISIMYPPSGSTSSAFCFSHSVAILLNDTRLWVAG